MLTVRFRFPGGLYHATPYGRHVNEGDVEWPPSPWRVARALVATGFTRLGWSGIPPECRNLLHAIGGHVPTWAVPPATRGHSRHYLPQFEQSTTKVIDAWIRLPRDGWAYATWPVSLTSTEIESLDALLRHLTYLGRAESWVDAERWEGAVPDGLVRVDTAGDEGDAVEVLRFEQVDRYRAWRAERVAGDAAQLLAEQQANDVAKGKTVRKALSKADSARIDAVWPFEPLDAALLRTSELHAARFAQPPGTRRFAWRRPLAALGGARVSPPFQRPRQHLTLALFSITPNTLDSNALMRLGESIWVGEKVHKALASVTNGAREFVADGDDHQHASILPLALASAHDSHDASWEKLPFRRIDHVLIWSPAGFTARVAETLSARGVRVWAKNLPEQRLDCLGLTNRLSELPDVPQFGTSRTWSSITPFVPSRFLKKSGRNNLEGQIAAELAWRGLPAPEKIEVDLRPMWRHFKCSRQEPGKGPPQRLWFGLRLSFAHPVTGPVLLGYGSHFGLGQFVPMAE